MQRAEKSNVKNIFAVVGFVLAMMFCVFTFLPSSSLSATSVPHHHENPYADLIAETNSDISVVYEVLTFDFTAQTGQYWSPCAMVTAEYTLNSPSAKTVRMGFPLEMNGHAEDFLPKVFCNDFSIVPIVYCFDSYTPSRNMFDNMTFEEILNKTSSPAFTLDDLTYLTNYYGFLLVYDVNLNAGENAMTVSYPMLGSYDGTYDPAIYTYQYFTNPARNWASFGGIDIKIITSYETTYMIESSVNFSTTYYGYIYSGALPDQNLFVSLSASQNPVKTNGFNWAILLLLVLFVIPILAFGFGLTVLIVVLVAIGQRKKLYYNRPRN